MCKTAAVTSVVAALFFLSSGLFTIKSSAAEAVSFFVTDCEAKPDRLISPRLEADSEIQIGAASIELFYDSEILEFRGVTSESGKIEYKEKTGSLKLEYLSSGDTDSTFSVTLSFKTKAEGNCNIDFTVSDCVDKNANEAEITACTSAEIKVSKNASETPDGVISDKRSSDKSADSSKKSKSANSSDSSAGSSQKSSKYNSNSSLDSTSDEPDFFGSFGSGSSPGIKFAAAGTAIGIAASIAAAVAYLLVKHRKEKKKE